MKIPFLLSILLWVLPAYANQDSLLQALQTQPRDTQTVWTYNELLLGADPADSTQVYQWFKEGLALADELQFPKGAIAVLNSMGRFYKSCNQPLQAISLHETALQRALKSGDRPSAAINNHNLGGLYNAQGKYATALSYYLEALKIFESLGDSKRAASTMMSIGNVHADNQNPDKAMDYYQKSMNTFRKLGDEKNVINLLINMGGLAFDRKKYESALEYFKDGLELSRKLNYSKGIYVSLNNISTIYRKQEKWEEALSFAISSQELRDASENLEFMSVGNVNLGVIYMGLKDWTNAEKRFRLAIKQATPLNAMETLEEALLGMSNVMEQKGHFKEALDYRRQYEDYHDSLTNRFSRVQVAEMEEKYAAEKKDLEIARQQLELENAAISISRKNILSGSLAAILLVLMLSGWLFYNRYKLRQQRKLDTALLKEQEIRNKAIIEAEEKERIRIAKDLHDGVGQQIATARLHLSVLQPTDPEQIEKWQALLKLIDDSAAELREVSHNMMPNALLHSGLAAAVRSFINKIAATGTLRTDLQIVGLNERLGETKETVLYRVLQECVSNIVKHAQASEVSIQLIRHEEELSMSIEDNGKGFDPAAITSFKGIGLRNIQSRIAFLNGTVDFDSRPGKGTLIMINIPV